MIILVSIVFKTNLLIYYNFVCYLFEDLFFTHNFHVTLLGPSLYPGLLYMRSV